MSDSVVIKHAGGADPVRFEHIAEPDRSAVIAARPSHEAAVRAAESRKGDTKADASSSESRVITGEIFLGGGVSQGVRVKFAGASVYAYPLEAARNAFDTYGRPNLPEPISSAVADGEGRFSLVVPKGLKIMIVAKGTHRAAVGRNSVDWEWRIADDQIQGDRLMLTDANAQPLQGRTL
jgi:hypothetical protein